MNKNYTIAVIGLGYVGLPVAVAFAQQQWRVIGFDIDQGRINELCNNIDRTNEIEPHNLQQQHLLYTHDKAALQQANIYIVTVPTPITQGNKPDLTPLIKATQLVGAVLKKGDIVVYESTVYPGATEEECVPLLEEVSKLTFGQDFQVGYSPERINPGDKTHTFSAITKVVSASDAQSLDILANLYGSVVKAGIHKAPSIRVAEAAKVLENTQRDVNIALINELALICDKVGIATKDVLAAAQTKWNFLPFTPGLVGGHCIGVDPYYLTYKAESLGLNPEVILSGRRINNNVGGFIAKKLLYLFGQARRISPQDAKIAVLGLTFKENVPDLRNSRVFDIIEDLQDFGCNILAHDAMIEDENMAGLPLTKWEDIHDIDALIVAVPHQFYLDNMASLLAQKLHKNAIIIDIKSCINKDDIQDTQLYWAL